LPDVLTRNACRRFVVHGFVRSVYLTAFLCLIVGVPSVATSPIFLRTLGIKQRVATEDHPYKLGHDVSARAIALNRALALLIVS
jgi:hypothetical protein